MTTLKMTEMFKDLGNMDAMVMKTKIKLETSRGLVEARTLE